MENEREPQERSRSEGLRWKRSWKGRLNECEGGDHDGYQQRNKHMVKKVKKVRTLKIEC